MTRGVILRFFAVAASMWLCMTNTTLAWAYSEVLDSSQKATPATATLVQEVIDEHLRFYNEHFDKIRFAHLTGGDDWSGELVAVLSLLGSKPAALDYQHPPDVRADVMDVTLVRLRQLLRADVVSATLIQVGTDSPLDRANLCLIALNPKRFIADDYGATRYMLDVKDDIAERIHPTRYLQHMEHLRFALDHEAFHCIDSFLYGGAPMTEQDLEAEYEMFRRESAADAYAMARHIQRHGRITPYARNLTHMRALWLFSDSPNRCTFETIREVLRTDPNRIQAMSLPELIDFAVALRDQAVRPYDGYILQRAAALQAARALGLDPALYGDQWCECERMEVDPKLVAKLVNRYRYYYEQLFTNTTLELEAPSLSESLEQR